VMENKENNIHFHLYDEQLTTINHIKFTHREIDIITSIVHMRGASKIAALLSISTRTVETHTANIMRKMDTNSREGIIDFVERAGHSSWIDKHYRNLLIQTKFKKLLQEVSKLTHNKSLICSIIYEHKQEEDEGFLSTLKKHLILSGIKTVLHKTSHEKTIGHSLLHEKYPARAHIIYEIPKRFMAQFQTDREKCHLEILHLVQKSFPNFSSLTFLFPEESNTNVIQDFRGIRLVGVGRHQDYFSIFFKILRDILSNANLDKTILKFMKELENPLDVPGNNLLSMESRLKKDGQKEAIVKNRKILGIILSLVTIIPMGLGLSLFFKHEISLTNRTEAGSSLSIRSDLIVPTENTLLNRPNIISQLGEYLKDNEGIQAVALVGIGGAGKTTIARRYALNQNANVVWEVNAATRENLRDSFERLAYALCRSEEEKETLVGLQDIKNKIERDEKILLFVKEKLKSISNWLLIYDNLEKFTDIQKYFPCDSTVWGKGKIIVTTRDSNTKNNSLIHNFIQIGELSPQEKLSLFIKIMTDKGTDQFTSSQEDQANNFLNDVPPFPLDVSIAAYYLKSTHITYAKYLERLKENSKDFETIQAKVVQEASDYTKTRYGIITLSLKQLIDTHEDFGDLLLLMSLLNSQNIPRALLSNYKSDVVVDNFIYNLKKYSLITSESSSNSIPTISVHKKTQEISINYLIKVLPLSNNSPLLDPIANTLENYILDAVDKEDFSRMKLLVAHCGAFLNHDHLITETAKSSIGGALGCLYYYLHNHKAKQMLEENLANLSQYYGKNHDKIALILVYLGNFYRVQGDCEKAKSLLEQSLLIYKTNHNDIRSAKALGYLGAVYTDLGDYQKAKILLEESRLIYEKYPTNPIGHAWILTYLGNTYMVLGDYQKAKALLEQSLMIYKQQSENYVGVSWVLGYLGTVYKLLGDYSKAKKLLEQSLTITKKYFSDDHIFVAANLSSLASVYTEEGNYQKAKTLLTKSLAVYEKNYGKNHIQTARVLKMLGEAYCGEGEDMEAAEDLINTSLLVFQKYPESYKSLESLADLYKKKAMQAMAEGDAKQAQNFKLQSIHYLKDALIVIKDYFSENSPHAKKIQLKLDKLTKQTEE
jgi:tetratricopeptide (TPR) repeat protein/DNA-binding CsgD family transcriptional regulator